jgi:hypothetical protein
MRRTILTFMAVAVLTCTMGTMAAAWDTSPYLVGKWEFGTYVATDLFTEFLKTEFEIINPTTRILNVYAVFRWEMVVGGPPVPIGCYIMTLFPNAVWELSIPVIGPEQAPPPWPPRTYGSVKFFAFPAGTTKFDPNAVIGGFQKKQLFKFEASLLGLPEYTDLSISEANLKAVIINSSTIGEFTTGIPFATCLPWPIPPVPPPPPPGPPYWPTGFF